jgi:GTP-binding protein HflX
LRSLKKAVIVGLETPEDIYDMTDLLEELTLLLANLNIDVAGEVVQKRASKDPAFLIGKGKAQEIALFGKSVGADLVVTDEELTPIQMANLRKTTGMEVWDRPYVIMKIFEARAHTAEAKLQVELAQCRYEIPHLKGLGLQMSRAGGGIGTRGPGETEFERHRRKLERKVRSITAKLENVKKRRELQRKRRNKSGLMTFSLAGYTNSGKSTLLRKLTSDDTIIVKDQLFCTLDTFVRKLELPSGRTVLLADTVGFIRKLPPGLVAAFRTTLEEIVLSDVILMVLDVSVNNIMEHFNVIQETLNGFQASGIPRIVVLNKIDLLDGEQKEFLLSRFRERGETVAAVSALTGKGVQELQNELDRQLSFSRQLKRSDGYAS